MKESIYNFVHVIPNTNENSIWLKFRYKTHNGNKDIYIGSYYFSPRNKFNKNELDIFEILNSETNRVRNKGTIIVQGDLNARTGRKCDFLIPDKYDNEIETNSNHDLITRNSEDSFCNIRGNELIDFCKTNDYVIANGRTLGDIYGSYTSHQWNGSSVVDYVLTPTIDYETVRNFSVGTFIPWLSDHCPIYSELNLSSPILKTELSHTIKLHKKEPAFIWNNESKEDFETILKNTTTKNKLENLLNNEKPDPIEIVKTIKDTLMSTANICNFRKNKVTNKNITPPWFDKQCEKMKNNIRECGNKLKKDPGDNELRSDLFKQKKNLQKSIKNKKFEYKNSIMNEMAISSNKDQKSFWALLKKLNNAEVDNTKYVSHEKFYNHFKSTLNSNRAVNMPPDNKEMGKLDYNFTLEELEKGCSILKNGKTTGIDNLSNEMIIFFVNIYPLITIKLFNNILHNNKGIPDWTVGMITTIHKKGSKSDPDNYRGISLLSCFGKLFTTLLNNRLLNYALTNKIISPNQLGFLPGNRTSDAHFIIHNLIQKLCHKKSSMIYSCFIDFSKAFDTIPRDKLLNKLLQCDIKGDFFNTIKNIYSNDKACIKINKEEVTDTFDTNQGVKQGCVLSPLLFNIYMSDLAMKLDSDINETNPFSDHPSCILWADDIILLSENEDGLRKMIKSMENYCKEKELILNTDKTKCMIFNKSGRLIRKYFSFNNSNLETVKSYKYLGFILTPSGEINTGLKDLRDRAMKAFYKLKASLGTLFHRNLTITLKLIDTLIKPILLYASDFWGSLKLPKNNPIENFHHMLCKQILGVQKQTTNIAVLLELGRVPLKFHAYKAATKNWERIKSKKVNIYVYKSYQNAIEENLPWTNNVKDLLEKNGMLCFYINTYENKPPFIHKKLFQRLSDIFHQEAFSTMANEQSKLRTYGLLKNKIGIENYLQISMNPLIRQKFTKFRVSNHSLNIEKGRHNNIPKEIRFCPFCKNSVETEIHFLLECRTYKTMREELLSPIINNKPAFVYYTMTEKFQHLLAKENTHISAKFVYNCFELRKFLMDKPKRLL